MAVPLQDLAPMPEVLHVGIGMFDGVHKGHQAIFRSILRDLASSREAAVLTFEPHPLTVINPDKAPPRLTVPELKKRLIHDQGVHHVVVLPFDQALRDLTAEQFVEAMHRVFPNLVEVSVGPGWKFGRDGKGDAALMQMLGLTCGFFTRTVDPVEHRGEPISSTRIREALRQRAFGDVEAMLGRPYMITGTVVAGSGRGRKMGFPTANITEAEQMFPATGVYFGKVKLEGKTYRAVMNYGLRPTVGAAERPVLEVHLLDYYGDLYGKKLEISGLTFIREEKRFEDVFELQEQIALDIEFARSYQ